jgi:hypothetical protein
MPHDVLWTSFPTATGLSLVLPHQKVLEEVPEELECDILERKRRTVE